MKMGRDVPGARRGEVGGGTTRTTQQVANRVATATLDRHSTTSNGSSDQSEGRSQLKDLAGIGNEKTPSGGDGVKSGRWDSNPRRQPWEGCILPLNYAREL